MDWFKIIDEYFKDGLYTVDHIKIFVVKNKITQEEFKTITGIDYVV